MVDYSQTINMFTELDAYPLPNMDDVVSKLALYSVFSAFDLRSAFHQVKLREEDKIYTAFQAGQRLFQFTRVPFGLRNSSAVFQRIMDDLVQKYQLEGVVTYIDNVYVGGATQREHDVNVERLINAAAEINITFNESKSIHSTRELSLLGYSISKGIKKPDPERVKALIDLPFPKNLDEQKRVLGLFAHFSRWIPKFSEVIHPLNSNDQFPISEQAKTSFNKVKSILSDTALMPIQEGIPFTVETDASKYAIGATLSQQGRPVAFMSRTLRGSELHHSAIEKEAYSIVEALRKWYHLLAGREFTLITDQKSVSFMFDVRHKSSIKNEKLLRWRIELSALAYNVVYRPGKDNFAADALSRACGVTAINSLKDIHEGLCHPGITRLNHYVRSKNLPYSTNEVKSVTESCKVCCEVKPRFFKPQNSHLIKAMHPFDRLSLDFKGPLPSNSKNKYLLDIVDEFSRFMFAFPCQDMTSSTVIKCLKQLFSIFGMPTFIHSDKGSSLLSQELRSFLHSNGIATSNTTPYNPAGNGQTERYNGVLWKSILLALKTKQLPVHCWEDVLPDVLHANRSLLCTATNSTPHERLFKHPRRTSLGNALPTWLMTPGPILIKNYYRANKYDPLVNEVELIDANPNFAKVRYVDGTEANVSIKDLAPAGDDTINHEKVEIGNDSINPTSTNNDAQTESPMKTNENSVIDEYNPTITPNDKDTVLDELRRSDRVRKPPVRLGY